VRNVLRLVDILPGAYLVGMITIIVTRRNQRLGDLAAGTLVVRERTVPPSGGWEARASAMDRAALEAWDATALTAEEVATVRRFLERRATLVSDARARLAAELAGRLRPKVAAPDDVGDERFLEMAIAAKALRSSG
jgi:hypothetical protein